MLHPWRDAEGDTDADRVADEGHGCEGVAGYLFMDISVLTLLVAGLIEEGGLDSHRGNCQ